MGTDSSKPNTQPPRTLYSGVVVAGSQGDARAILAASPDWIVVVERGVPRMVLFECPSGCGDVLTVNLDAAAAEAWRLRRTDGAVTLMPSVWRTSGCGAHFVLWRNRVLWCRLGEGDEPDWPDDVDEELTTEWRRIRRQRRRTSKASFED